MQVHIFYRNFKKFCYGLSHVGLGNNAMLTAKSLKDINVDCRVHGVDNAQHIADILKKFPTTATHAIVEAAFFGVTDANQLSNDFPEVDFVYRNHSQIAFLQVEPNAINWFRDFAKLQEMALNVRLSGNSDRFTEWWESAYNQRCLYLPNLYPLIDRTRVKVRHSPSRDTLRIGAFGSLRLLKNFTTCAAAAMLIAKRLDRNLELYMNVGRTENGGRVIVDAVENMFKGLPWAKLVKVDWQDWTQFRHTIGHMDLTLQCSFTETFNIVTADSIAEGVPAVVSTAIDWVPDYWQADCDNPEDIAVKGVNLVLDSRSAEVGLNHLKRYQREALATWKDYLKI